MKGKAEGAVCAVMEATGCADEKMVVELLKNAGWSAEVAVARHAQVEGQRSTVPECPDAAVLADMVAGVPGAWQEWGHPHHCFWAWLVNRKRPREDSAPAEMQQPQTQPPAAATKTLSPDKAKGRALSEYKSMPFAYSAVKSKVASTTTQGPPDGSTWEWYLVADLSVGKPGEDGARKVRISGDKFQAGWVRSAKDATKPATLRERKATMVQSLLKGTPNAYGLQRAGCPVGFRHKWTYSDSTWDKAGLIATTDAVWTEVKHEDRWKVCVEMTWAGASDYPEGDYLIIADQRAEKLNCNQYQTHMKGHVFPTTSAPKEVTPEFTTAKALAAAPTGLKASILGAQLEKYQPPVKSSLGAWVVKRPRSEEKPTGC